MPSALSLAFPIARATAQRQNRVQVYGTQNGEWQRWPMTYAIGGKQYITLSISGAGYSGQVLTFGLAA